MLAGLRSRRRLVWAGFVAFVLTLTGVVNAPESRADQLALTDDSPLIIIGVGGLLWPNISPQDTPTLWNLLDDPTTSAGAVTVHTDGQPVCPTGGWLALSSGRPTPSPRLGSLCL